MAFIARTDEFGNETMRIMLCTNPARPTVAYCENLMINCSSIPNEVSGLDHSDNQQRFHCYAELRRLQKQQIKRQKQRKLLREQMLLSQQSFRELEKSPQTKRKSPNLYFYSWLAANNVAQLQRAIDRGLITQPDDQQTFERAMVVQMKYHKWFQTKCRQLRRTKSDLSLKPTDQWSLSTKEAHCQMLQRESEKLAELSAKHSESKKQEQELNVADLEETNNETHLPSSNESKPSPTKRTEKPKRCVPDYERINRLALPRRPLLHQNSGCSNRHKDCLKVVLKEEKNASSEQETRSGDSQSTNLQKENVEESKKLKLPQMSKLEKLIKELTEDIDRELEESKSYALSARKVSKEKRQEKPTQSSKVQTMKPRQKSDTLLSAESCMVKKLKTKEPNPKCSGSSYRTKEKTIPWR